MAERIASEARYTAELYYKGVRLLLTLPYETAPAIAGTLDELLRVGFSTKPEVLYQAPETPEKETPKETRANVCPIHNLEMRKFEKNGKSWFSHKTDAGWCNGKHK